MTSSFSRCRTSSLCFFCSARLCSSLGDLSLISSHLTLFAGVRQYGETLRSAFHRHLARNKRIGHQRKSWMQLRFRKQNVPNVFG